MTGIPALTLHQPWASLVALGVKSVETRSWRTDYRGPLVIHAGARQVHSGHFLLLARTARTAGLISQEDERRFRSLDVPFGAIVATCRLVDVVLTDDLRAVGPERGWVQDARGRYAVGDAEVRFGDFFLGRYAWLLEDVKPTTERCPACWGEGWIRHDPDGESSDGCPVCTPGGCGGTGTCDPVPARGRQGLWRWATHAVEVNE